MCGEVDESSSAFKSDKGGSVYWYSERFTWKKIVDIGYAIQQQYCESHSYGVVREFVGHGIGKKCIEKSQVPNYGKRDTVANEKEGFALQSNQ